MTDLNFKALPVWKTILTLSAGLIVSGCAGSGAKIWEAKQKPRFEYSQFRFATEQEQLLVQLLPESGASHFDAAEIVKAIATLPQFHGLRDKIGTDPGAGNQNRLVYLFNPAPQLTGTALCAGEVSTGAETDTTQMLLAYCAGDRRLASLKASQSNINGLESEKGRAFIRDVTATLLPIHQPRRTNSNN